VPAEVRDVTFFRNNQTSSVTPPSLPFIWYRGPGFYPGSKSAEAMKSITEYHLVSWLRMSGGLLLLPYVPSWRGGGM